MLYSVINDKITSSSADISEAFGKNWSEYSKDTQFSACFNRSKTNILESSSENTNICTDAKPLEKPFNLLELNQALSNAKGKTPGFDRISYPMLYNLPLTAKLTLLKIYNQILQHGFYPHSWRSAVMVTI